MRWEALQVRFEGRVTNNSTDMVPWQPPPLMVDVVVTASAAAVDDATRVALICRSVGSVKVPPETLLV